MFYNSVTKQVRNRLETVTNVCVVRPELQGYCDDVQ